MKTLLCVIIFFAFINAIASYKDVFENMSLDERRSYFGTENGSIPECEIVELVTPLPSTTSWNPLLQITFNAFGTPLTVTLYVVGDNNLINRRQTGIWNAHSSTTAYQNVVYSPWPEAFDVIGNFELLQNVEEGSALARFWDSYGNENIVGILRHSYTVKSFPKKFEHLFLNISQNYIVGEKPVNSMNGQDKKPLFLTICKNDVVPEEYVRRFTFANNDTLPDPNLHRLRRQSINATKVPDVVHPKLLVIPDFSIISRYEHDQDFMMQLIGQLNSVDMMYRQLKDPEVHLNIAGIIIPRDDGATPYLSKHVDAHNRLDGEAAVHEAEMNFQMEKRRFPHDEWDTILMLTTYNISSYNGGMQSQVGINGYSPIARGCSGAAAIARFTENMEGIYTLAHGLGHMFGVNHDEDEVGAGQCTNTDGYLMVTGYNYFQELAWSNCSRAAFQTYFRSDAGKCTYSKLRVIPDAIKSMQGPWLPIDGQCDNKFNDSTDYCMQPFDNSPDCTIFGCKRNSTCNWILFQPMEGSLFDGNNGRWACINSTMVFQWAYT